MHISKDLKRWGIYTLAGLFSVALHGLVVFLLLLGGAEKSPSHKPKRPNFVQATLVQMEPRAKAQDKRAANKKAAQATKKRAEKKRREKERKRKVAARKKAEQKKAQAEKTRRDKARKKKQTEEKARQAAQQKQAARDKQAAQAKREEQQAALQRQARAEALASALDSEDEFLADAQNVQLAQGYQSYIQQRIITNWNRPPSARRGMEAVLSIQLVPTGQVVGVSVLKSSGNEAFDLSAKQAVKQVGRFDQLKELSRQSPGVFEQYFRQFQLVFRPEDLRL